MVKITHNNSASARFAAFNQSPASYYGASENGPNSTPPRTMNGSYSPCPAMQQMFPPSFPCYPNGNPPASMSQAAQPSASASTVNLRMTYPLPTPQPPQPFARSGKPPLGLGQGNGHASDGFSAPSHLPLPSYQPYRASIRPPPGLYQGSARVLSNFSSRFRSPQPNSQNFSHYEGPMPGLGQSNNSNAIGALGSDKDRHIPKATNSYQHAFTQTNDSDYPMFAKSRVMLQGTVQSRFPILPAPVYYFPGDKYNQQGFSFTQTMPETTNGLPDSPKMNNTSPSSGSSLRFVVDFSGRQVIHPIRQPRGPPPLDGSKSRNFEERARLRRGITNYTAALLGNLSLEEEPKTNSQSPALSENQPSNPSAQFQIWRSQQ